MLLRNNWILASLVIPALLLVAGCSSSQKTVGVGLTSATAQKVVRLSIIMAMRKINLRSVYGREVSIRAEGFVDDAVGSYLKALIREDIRDAGGIFRENSTDLQLQILVHSGGEDRGDQVDIFFRRWLVTGEVNFDIVVTDLETGGALSNQSLTGKAKYEQARFMGMITDNGKFYVWEPADTPTFWSGKGKWTHIKDPVNFK